MYEVRYTSCNDVQRRYTLYVVRRILAKSIVLRITDLGISVSPGYEVDVDIGGFGGNPGEGQMGVPGPSLECYVIGWVYFSFFYLVTRPSDLNSVVQ